MTKYAEGQKVVIETEVTADNPDWVAVRVQFGRMVQNIRVDKSMVRAVEEPTEKVAKAQKTKAG
jgi:hypothetical protein